MIARVKSSVFFYSGPIENGSEVMGVGILIFEKMSLFRLENLGFLFLEEIHRNWTKRKRSKVKTLRFLGFGCCHLTLWEFGFVFEKFRC